MPLGKGIRYRYKNGVRLAFKGSKVIEVKKKGGTAHRVSAGRSPRRRARRR